MKKKGRYFILGGSRTMRTQKTLYIGCGFALDLFGFPRERWYFCLSIGLIFWHAYIGVRFKPLELLIEEKPECFYSDTNRRYCDGSLYMNEDGEEMPFDETFDPCEGCKWKRMEG